MSKPPGSTQSGLDAISGTAASSCVAAGNWYDSSNNSHTLAEGLTTDINKVTGGIELLDLSVL